MLAGNHLGRNAGAATHPGVWDNPRPHAGRHAGPVPAATVAPVRQDPYP
jgi:hypothetical protein